MSPIPTALLTAALLLAPPDPAPPPALRVKGSDTIGGALGPALARAFEAASPGVRVQWEGLGSSTAFVGLLDGSADLGASSRSVSAAELARAKELGVELREFVLGYDGIAVVVHPENPVRQLTVAQLSALFAGKVASWAELGGPDRRPVVYSRPGYSGTHDFFRDKVLRRGDRHAQDAFAPATIYLEHSSELVEAVAGDPAAVTYVGMGWLRAGVEPLAVAATPAGPYVRPTTEAVRQGSYAVSRPLLLYTRGEPRGELRRLVQLALGAEGQKLVAAHEFTPADVPALAQRSPAASASAPAPALAPRRIHFASGAASLPEDARTTLDRVAADAARSGARVRLVGHSDARGGAAANLRLAGRRAEAVAAGLVRRGVRRDRLLLEVAGSDAPLATNETPAGRSANRRVDLVLIPTR